MSIEKLRDEHEPRYVKDLEPIEAERGKIEITRAMLESLVEAPLLSACQELYDKNVLTLASSANKKDVATGHAYIFIDYSHLSSENRKIAEEFGGPTDFDGMPVVKIEIPISEESTVSEISEMAEAIAHRFQHQEPTWIESFTLEDIKRFYGIPPDDDELKPEELSGEDGFYYDADTNAFYHNSEQAQKKKQAHGR